MLFTLNTVNYSLYSFVCQAQKKKPYQKISKAYLDKRFSWGFFTHLNGKLALLCLQIRENASCYKHVYNISDKITINPTTSVATISAFLNTIFLKLVLLCLQMQADATHYKLVCDINLTLQTCPIQA